MKNHYQESFYCLTIPIPDRKLKQVSRGHATSKLQTSNFYARKTRKQQKSIIKTQSLFPYSIFLTFGHNYTVLKIITNINIISKFNV